MASMDIFLNKFGFQPPKKSGIHISPWLFHIRLAGTNNYLCSSPDLTVSSCKNKDFYRLEYDFSDFSLSILSVENSADNALAPYQRLQIFRKENWFKCETFTFPHHGGQKCEGEVAKFKVQFSTGSNSPVSLHAINRRECSKYFCVYSSMYAYPGDEHNKTLLEFEPMTVPMR